ncbi:hypothetical protein [Glycomyces dulcitolivorans]|uniref:hypothetical protein n=1 Tax=Glycomyces dulcitolivorans TaxID=2200759 RepID=UPI0013004D9C|nr:hypothetical protein [Glycomyces dulcitolivorans]
MSDSNLVGRESDSAPARKAAKTRSRTVKPGHIEVGEFTSGHIGAASPFGTSAFPFPVKDIYFEHTPPVPTRHLEDERH